MTTNTTSSNHHRYEAPIAISLANQNQHHHRHHHGSYVSRKRPIVNIVDAVLATNSTSSTTDSSTAMQHAHQFKRQQRDDRSSSPPSVSSAVDGRPALAITSLPVVSSSTPLSPNVTMLPSPASASASPSSIFSFIPIPSSPSSSIPSSPVSPLTATINLFTPQLAISSSPNGTLLPSPLPSSTIPPIPSSMPSCDDTICINGTSINVGIPAGIKAPEISGSGNLELRFLVSTSLMGGVLGRDGIIMRAYRLASGATIITDHPSEALRRIITIRGTTHQVWHASLLIIEKVAAKQSQRAGVSLSPHKSQPLSNATPSNESTITLLISSEFVGWIIGKGGNRIASVRESSGCKVAVSEQTLAHSTDKIISIKGDIHGIYRALTSLCPLIAAAHDNTMTSHITRIPYQPPQPSQMTETMSSIMHNGFYGAMMDPSSLAMLMNMNMNMPFVHPHMIPPPPPSHVTMPTNNGATTAGMVHPRHQHHTDIAAFHSRHGHYSHHDMMHAHPPGHGYGAPLPPSMIPATPLPLVTPPPPPPSPSPPSSPPKHNNGGNTEGNKSLVMPLMKDAAGFLIGSTGTTIELIRHHSACYIKISDLDTNGTRDVSLRGKPSQIERALNCIYQVLMNQPGGRGMVAASLVATFAHDHSITIRSPSLPSMIPQQAGILPLYASSPGGMTAAAGIPYHVSYVCSPAPVPPSSSSGVIAYI